MKDFHIRRGAHWMVISLFVAVTGCGGDSGTNGEGGSGDGGGSGPPLMTTSATIADFSFTPVSILVSSGATVTWAWTGAAPHNVTFASSRGLRPLCHAD